MKAIFLGATKFSAEILQSLIENQVEVIHVFTIPEEFGISYSDKKVKNYNYADIGAICKKNNIDCSFIDSAQEIKLGDQYDLIKKLNADVILVMGWYYMVPKKIRELAKHGAWGIHASLLPDYAGGAPLVWAIINGEKETGVTLFRLEDGVDDGDIIAQEKISIGENETIKEVYEKATLVSKKILNSVLKQGHINYIPQDKTKLKVYPQRKPEDGLIDWSWEPKKIKDFIRAQTKPYPGAFTVIDGKKVIVWDADVI